MNGIHLTSYFVLSEEYLALYKELCEDNNKTKIERLANLLVLALERTRRCRVPAEHTNILLRMNGLDTDESVRTFEKRVIEIMARKHGVRIIKEPDLVDWATTSSQYVLAGKGAFGVVVRWGGDVVKVFYRSCEVRGSPEVTTPIAPWELRCLISAGAAGEHADNKHVTKIKSVVLGNTHIGYQLEDGGTVLHRFVSPMATKRMTRRVVTQLCEAVASLHARNLVHGDLKPGNILIKQRFFGSPQVKICDFGGCAFNSVPTQRVPYGSKVSITYAYGPPEVLRHEVNWRQYKQKIITEEPVLYIRSNQDLWSLGLIMLYIGRGDGKARFYNTGINITAHGGMYALLLDTLSSIEEAEKHTKEPGLCIHRDDISNPFYAEASRLLRMVPTERTLHAT